MINRCLAAILGTVFVLSIQAIAQPPAPKTDREKQQLEGANSTPWARCSRKKAYFFPR